MKLTRPIFIFAAVGLAIALPLGAGAVASSSGVQPTTGMIAGVIDDSHGASLAGVCVTVWDSQLNSAGQGQSGSNGTYSLTTLPGTYTVVFDGCGGFGHPNVQAQNYDNTQIFASRSQINVVAGQTTQLNPQTLLPGGQITIKVTDTHGAVIPNFKVIAYPTFSQAPQFLQPSGAPSVNPDASNVWHFVDLMPLDYVLGYFYCPPANNCVSVGSYHAQPWNSTTPTVVHGVAGATVSVTDAITLPSVATTTTVVSASPVAPTLGQPVTLTAKVTTSDGTTASGMVDFETSSADFGHVQLGPTGVAAVTTTALGLGSSNIYADYSGQGLQDSSFGGVAVTVGPAPVTAGGGGGGGASSPASGSVTAGGTFASDPAGTTPGASNPLVVGITSPVAGPITIDKTPSNTPVTGYTVLGVGATITAPVATAANPLNLSFQIFVGDLPAGSYASDLTVFRNGVAIGACTGAGATPDPCVASTGISGGVATIDVRSSHASTWDVESAHVGRIAGVTRFATAVAASQDSFPTGHAGAVVLARADDYPDALVGAPLAAAKNAPLLLTQGATLPAVTAAEIARVLPTGGTVYLLGGTAAIPASVAIQLGSMGYHAVRYAGADRYATAVAVADALGDPSTILLATGSNFPDALSAGPAAARAHGAVLLTNGNTLPAATSAYLSAKSTTVYAIGGPAAIADPHAIALLGADRFATAAAVATKFFPSPATIGIATGATFPDALAGGAQLALIGAPLLLSTTTAMPGVTTTYLSTVHGGVKDAHVFGGTAALDDGVVSQLRAAVGS